MLVVIDSKFVSVHVVFRASVMDYLRAHDEKMLAQMGLDVNHKSMLNPWAGNDTRSMVDPRVGTGDGGVMSQPVSLMKMKSAATTATTTTTAHRGGAGQILIYLLRLRQCCSHLSILKDVNAFCNY